MTETPTERNRRIFEDATAAGEPVFVLRAKDTYAPYAIEQYGGLVAAGEGDRFDPAFGEALDAAVSRFHEWRRANPDSVKAPDLRP
jgi:hypothetical protein